jgi:hypothetical protein
MAHDYDNDHFNRGLKFQHYRESGHGHGQKVPKSKKMKFNFERLLKQQTKQKNNVFRQKRA